MECSTIIANKSAGLRVMRSGFTLLWKVQILRFGHKGGLYNASIFAAELLFDTIVDFDMTSDIDPDH